MAQPLSKHTTAPWLPHSRRTLCQPGWGIPVHATCRPGSWLCSLRGLSAGGCHRISHHPANKRPQWQEKCRWQRDVCCTQCLPPHPLRAGARIAWGAVQEQSWLKGPSTQPLAGSRRWAQGPATAPRSTRTVSIVFSPQVSCGAHSSCHHHAYTACSRNMPAHSARLGIAPRGGSATACTPNPGQAGVSCMLQQKTYKPGEKHGCCKGADRSSGSPGRQKHEHSVQQGMPDSERPMEAMPVEHPATDACTAGPYGTSEPR
jgi:hypothetical protein